MKFLMKTKNVFTILFLSLVALASSDCKKSSGSSSSYPKTVAVEYRVTSPTGNVTKITAIGYTNATGGTSNFTELPLPFSQKLNRTVNQADVLGLVISHNNSASSVNYSIKLDILVDGSVVKTETFVSNSNVTGSIVHYFQ